MSVTPRGMSVQEAYREYRDDNFRVNRRYQRRLVWTLDEKRKLIDSLLHGYPIPLFRVLAHRRQLDREGLSRANQLAQAGKFRPNAEPERRLAEDDRRSGRQQPEGVEPDDHTYMGSG